MYIFVESFIVLILLVICLQLYFFASNSIGVQRQDRCQKLGIAFMTIGIVALIFKTVPIVSFGLILLMFGFRLVSNGLDRLDKNLFDPDHKNKKH
jgi:hypothetical protein